MMEDNIIQEATPTKSQLKTKLTDDATIQNCFALKEKIEQERIKNWRTKQADISTRFEFVTDTNTYDDKTKQTNVTIAHKFDKDVENDTQKGEIINSTLFAATGSTDQGFSHMLLGQAINACGDLTKDAAKNANAVMNALLEMAPKDPYKGMLISRLIALHSQYMRFMQSSNGSNDKAIDLNINRATKLMRIYNETLETLNRYRRKGEQRVIVQHVNVNNGGQAIVANKYNQQTQGGGNDKK